MCSFFSFCTDGQGGRYYIDWQTRKSDIYKLWDKHSIIADFHGFKGRASDKLNKYEYNPLTKEFTVDQINNEVDDRVQAEEWVRELDFKKVIEPLIVKDIVNPLKLKKRSRVTKKDIKCMEEWDGVRDSVWASVGASVWASVGPSVGDSVGDSVWDSVGDSVWAYISSFFAIRYDYDFSCLVELWERGLVPSFDGKTWRLHSGEKADVVYVHNKEVSE